MTPDSPTDLSKRLREEADNFVADPEDATDFDFRIARRLREAADEIERLTKALRDADAALVWVKNYAVLEEWFKAPPTVHEAISAARARKDQS